MRKMVQRLGLAFAAAAVTLSNTGCLLNLYPADPNDRLQVLFNESENLRQARQEYLRFWQVDMPSHLTPERVDGGIMP